MEMEVSTIKKLIAKSKTKEAIQELIEYCSKDTKHTTFLNELIILSGEFEKYNRDVRLFGLKADDNRTNNKINSSLLQIIDELSSNKTTKKFNGRGKAISLINASLDSSSLFSSQNGEITLFDYKIRRDFSVVDFKLKNHSSKKILLHKFKISVQSYELNITPELEFFIELQSKVDESEIEKTKR